MNICSLLLIFTPCCRRTLKPWSWVTGCCCYRPTVHTMDGNTIHAGSMDETEEDVHWRTTQNCYHHHVSGSPLSISSLLWHLSSSSVHREAGVLRHIGLAPSIITLSVSGVLGSMLAEWMNPKRILREKLHSAATMIMCLALSSLPKYPTVAQHRSIVGDALR